MVASQVLKGQKPNDAPKEPNVILQHAENEMIYIYFWWCCKKYAIDLMQHYTKPN